MALIAINANISHLSRDSNLLFVLLRKKSCRFAAALSINQIKIIVSPPYEQR